MMDISKEKWNLCISMVNLLRNQKEVFKIRFCKIHWIIGTDSLTQSQKCDTARIKRIRVRQEMKIKHYKSLNWIGYFWQGKSKEQRGCLSEINCIHNHLPMLLSVIANTIKPVDTKLTKLSKKYQTSIYRQ